MNYTNPFVVWLMVDSEHEDTDDVDKDTATHHEEDIDGQQRHGVGSYGRKLIVICKSTINDRKHVTQTLKHVTASVSVNCS